MKALDHCVMESPFASDICGQYNHQLGREPISMDRCRWRIDGLVMHLPEVSALDVLNKPIYLLMEVSSDRGWPVYLEYAPGGMSVILYTISIFLFGNDYYVKYVTNFFL